MTDERHFEMLATSDAYAEGYCQGILHVKKASWPLNDNDYLPLLRAQSRMIEQMRQALENINRRASPGPDRTFDDCSRDLYWCASEARRVLA